MSKGKYNPTYFKNHPEESISPGVLYIVVLVNTKTNRRDCVKIGITKGTNYRDAIRRSSGFKGYEIRIQKLVQGTLEEVYYLEDYLHELWASHRYMDSHRFGGHTELFNIDQLKNILASIPDRI